LVVGAWIGFRELGVGDVVGPVAKFQGWDSLLWLRPRRPLSFWLLLLMWFRSRTMLRALVVVAM
jgi:hypothetical protein